jgi:putative membrane protein
MKDLVHRHAPVGARPRAALTLLATLLGVPTLLWGLVGLTAVPGNPAVFGLVVAGGLLTAVAVQLTRGLVGEAQAAPREANPVMQSHRGTEESPIGAGGPVDTLQARYARGEVSDEEFDRRMERLLEAEAATGGEGVVETARER